MKAGSFVSVRCVASSAGEIPRHEGVDLFVQPSGGDAFEGLGEPAVRIGVIEAGRSLQ